MSAAAYTGAPTASNSINLIHKDDARRMPPGLIKQIAHAAGAHAHKHFNKFAAADAKEWHSRFAAHGLGQQCFTRAWGTD